jgi:hypothetical protein
MSDINNTPDVEPAKIEKDTVTAPVSTSLANLAATTANAPTEEVGVDSDGLDSDEINPSSFLPKTAYKVMNWAIKTVPAPLVTLVAGVGKLYNIQGTTETVALIGLVSTFVAAVTIGAKIQYDNSAK